MELTFNKTSNGYIAEYSATTHFNLHIEGAGSVSLFRRTSGKDWDFVKALNGSVIDEDVAVNIPKDWKLSLAKRPTMAVVTFNGMEIPDEPESGDVPSGYELFLAYDGEFLTADGELYVLS